MVNIIFVHYLSLSLISKLLLTCALWYVVCAMPHNLTMVLKVRWKEETYAIIFGIRLHHRVLGAYWPALILGAYWPPLFLPVDLTTGVFKNDIIQGSLKAIGSAYLIVERC